MEGKQRVLSLLGLALRGGNLAVGEEPVEAAVRASGVRLLLVACDAAGNTCRRAEHFAAVGQCLWLRAPFTKEELGRAVGRSAAALAAVTDTGLAAAVCRRLAELDPGQYGDAAERLELKARRAAERKAEQRARDKQARRRPQKSAIEPPRKRQGAPGPSKKRPGQSGPDKAGKRPGVPPPAAADRPDGQRRTKSRPSKENRPKPPGGRARPYAHSHPVKKGKGSFRKDD